MQNTNAEFPSLMSFWPCSLDLELMIGRLKGMISSQLQNKRSFKLESLDRGKDDSPF